MRKFLLLSLIFASLLTSLPEASACGGFEITGFEHVVEFSDVVVSGRVDYVDDLGKNFILNADRYYKGSGGAYIPVVSTRPSSFYGDAVRNYSNGCYNVRPTFEFREGDYGYFALVEGSAATYGYWFESVWIPGEEFYERIDAAPFGYESRPENNIAFISYRQSELGVESPLSTEEFELLLLKLSGRTQEVEPQGLSYPLMRFLNIRTESGERYRLNPNYSVTHLDPAKSPIAISNDGSHVLFRLDSDELAVQYMARVKKAIHPCAYCVGIGSLRVGGGSALSTGDYSTDGWLHPFKGWFARFSPDSNFIAVQESDRLVIYMLNNWHIEQYGYGQEMSLEIVAGQTVWWHPRYEESWNRYLVEREPLEWSADSTTLAYQDDRGIWHWDLFEETHPQLVLPTDHSSTLLDISLTGRYVRYEHDESWSLLDVISGESYERAIAAPDERNRIFVRPAFPDDTMTVAAGRESYTRDTYRRCQAPLSNCPIHVTFPDLPFRTFEYQPGWMGLVSHANVKIFPWQLAMEEGRLYVATQHEEQINAFDYDDRNNIPAIGFDDYWISFRFHDKFSRMRPDYRRYSAVNLETELDSPIIELEWGQPVFYEMH